MGRFEVLQRKSGVSLGIYEADTSKGAIAAMLADGGEPDATPDSGLVAKEVRGSFYLAPVGAPADRHAAGWDGNHFASAEEAEAAIAGLQEAIGGEWTVEGGEPTSRDRLFFRGQADGMEAETFPGEICPICGADISESETSWSVQAAPGTGTSGMRNPAPGSARRYWICTDCGESGAPQNPRMRKGCFV